jgi:hypothetical protein
VADAPGLAFVDFGVGLVECTGVLFDVAFAVGSAVVRLGAQFVAAGKAAADAVGVVVVLALALALADPAAPDDPALGLAGELAGDPLLVTGLPVVGLDVAAWPLAVEVLLGDAAAMADEAGELATAGHEGRAEGCLLTVIEV